MSHLSLAHYRSRLETVETFKAKGKVVQVVGLLIEGSGPGLPVGGDMCHRAAKLSSPEGFPSGGGTS